MVFLPLPSLAQEPASPIRARVICSDSTSQDQDDMCIWIHPTDPAQSTIVAADKEANRLFVYALDGKTIQTIEARHPGNIDVRYAFPLSGAKADIVAVNLRDESKIAVYQVDVRTRRLVRADNDDIRTATNYGGTLYQSSKTDKVYFVTTSKEGHVEQYELAFAGKIVATKVRSWQIGECEAAVADDETGKLYFGEEDGGVWEVGAEPGDSTTGKLIIKLGENGLTGDVEGLAIYHLPNGTGYLLVSNQGSNNFKVYERTANHKYLGTFAIQGAEDTDGIDVSNTNLGRSFPLGLFACHTAEGDGNCPVLLVPWEAIARAVPPGLAVDVSWSPRND
jgi:3-phytase